MEPRRNLDFLLGVSLLLAVGLLFFELYIFLTIPAVFMLVGVLSKKFTAAFSSTLRYIGSLINTLVIKFILSIFFLFILLPIVIAQGLTSRS